MRKETYFARECLFGISGSKIVIRVSESVYKILFWKEDHRFETETAIYHPECSSYRIDDRLCIYESKPPVRADNRQRGSRVDRGEGGH